MLVEALEDISRLETTIEELLVFARRSTVRAATTDLGRVLEKVQSRWNGPLADRGRPLIVSWPREHLTVTGSEGSLGQAFDTLLDNALTHGAGEVRLDTRFTHESVTVAVTDHGPGLPPGGFDAVDDADGTHGFGLALAERLVTAHGGRLIVARRRPDPIIEVVLRRVNASDNREAAPIDPHQARNQT